MVAETKASSVLARNPFMEEPHRAMQRAAQRACTERAEAGAPSRGAASRAPRRCTATRRAPA
ncbi:hypothetical protein C0Z18_11610 [Trinickia dabaoshanensis]|uniref:Uncharacterized protein n=1 Tax=Trinickia dabaoshanensis TaxID=564714 RepID=A0A2N7VSC2_9BURK|nr:hypothetical protein C0Z18_11610 [Trinickia dabaoshanensis]